MNIELNEYEWVERMLEQKSLGRKQGEALSKIARYYYENNYKNNEIREELEHFLLQCDPSTDLNYWNTYLDKSIRNVKKTRLSCVESIHISKPEIKQIKGLKGVQIQRLAFTLLCLAKSEIAKGTQFPGWVKYNDKDIMKMANISTSIERQCMMYNRLREDGLLAFSKKTDSLQVQVLFIEDGETAMEINDTRNLGYQYMKYCGEPYFECANCGIVTKIREPKKGRPQKYCPSCAVEVKTRQSVNSVMRQRNGLMN